MQRAVGICSVVRYHRPDRAPSCDLYATPSAPIDQNAGRTFAVGTKTPRSMSPMVLQPVNAIAESSSPLMMPTARSEEHTSELQSLMRISYAVFCLKKKTKRNTTHNKYNTSMYHTMSKYDTNMKINTPHT